MKKRTKKIVVIAVGFLLIGLISLIVYNIKTTQRKAERAADFHKKLRSYKEREIGRDSADLNGDSIDDIIIAKREGGRSKSAGVGITICLSTPEGDFTINKVMWQWTRNDTWEVRDYNGDGSKDIILYPNESHRRRVAFNDGKGNFKVSDRILYVPNKIDASTF